MRKMRWRPRLRNPEEHEEHVHRHYEKAPVHERPDRGKAKRHDED